jgi:tRNA threonylcarbamoyladenosine modification (KEOPS) complex  Pcc1 subunit
MIDAQEVEHSTPSKQLGSLELALCAHRITLQVIAGDVIF